MPGQNIMLQGTIPERAQSNAQQRELVRYIVPMTSLRVFDNMAASLPNAASSDDLGIIGGTFGTGSPSVQTSDSKATSVTQKARFLWSLPPEWDAGQSIVARFYAGMLTTQSDTSATIDLSVYKMDKSAGIGSDLVLTTAQTINDLTAGTYADRDFTIEGSSLVVGDSLDIQITVAIVDSATGTAVIGFIGEIAMLQDIRMG